MIITLPRYTYRFEVESKYGAFYTGGNVQVGFIDIKEFIYYFDSTMWVDSL